MAEEIGALRAALSASSAAFAADMKKAKDAVRSNASGMERAMDGVKKSFNSTVQSIKVLAIAATGIAATFALMANRAVETADKIQKFSTRIGVSTEALSELKYAAELSGVSFETLAMAMQRSTRRIAEAATGTGEAKAALKELGLDAQKLNQLKPDKQLETLADAIAGVGSQSDRVRLAMKLFDSEGVSLLQLFEKGASGIRDFREEAKELGLTLTPEGAAKLIKYKDSMTRLKESVNALAQEITIELAPAIGDVVDSMTEWVKKNKEFVATKVHNSLKNINESMSGILETYNAMPDSVVGPAGTGLIIGALFGSWKLGAAVAAIHFTKNELEGLQGALEKYNEEILKNAGATDIDPFSFEKMKKEMKDLPDVGPDFFNDLWEQIEPKTKNIENNFNDVKDTFSDVVGEIEKMTDALEDFYTASDQDIVADLNAHLERNRRNTEVAVDNDLTFFFDFMDNKKEKHEETLKEMSEFERQAYRNMESYAGSAFFDVMDRNYDGLLDSFKTMLKRMLSEWLAAQAMMAAFGPDFGKGGKLGGFIGSALSFLNPLKMAKGGMITEPIFGIGASGRSYMMGEAGPEAVIPMNNMIEGPGANSVEVNVSIDARGADAGVDQKLRRLVPQITAAATSGTLEAIRRGGYAREVTRG